MAEGYKDWSAGDILTAADLEDYTVKQSVMRFDDSSARTTALSGVLAEGMMSYLKDTDTVEVYDGSAWAAVAGGKILQVLQTTKTTSFSTSSTSLVDVTGLAVSITPTSATSKVLVQIGIGLQKSDTNYIRLSVFRGNAATGTNLASPSAGFGLLRADTGPYGFGVINYLDSPATTSATTYQAAVSVTAGSGSVQGEKSTITVWEVAA